MSKKFVVVKGAQCECKFGDSPDALKITSHSKYYASDKNGADKLIATTMELGGATFQSNTFGKCKLQPTGSSYKPCQIVVSKWIGFYQDVELGNGGKILVEDSKAVCPISGSPCISITDHGQAAEGSVSSGNEDQQVQQQLNPLSNPTEQPSELKQIQFS
ncbi:hypothetical protein GCM10022393_02010 [Aquimarina addita]|uniref:DUF4280 domain-containing protein n=1 Tax=Aquimarina addita TaxID=870485 RepID=A0ABP7X898_9FLAO